MEKEEEEEEEEEKFTHPFSVAFVNFVDDVHTVADHDADRGKATLHHAQKQTTHHTLVDISACVFCFVVYRNFALSKYELELKLKNN